MSDRNLSDRYARIRTALAMGPTPGEWYWTDAYPTQDGRKTWSLIGDGGFGILSCDGDENSPQSVNAAAAELIAACDPDTIRELLAERDQLAAALEAAREDAERYRWLRDPCSGAEQVIFYCRGDYGRGLMSGTMLDAAIDAAMAKEARND